MEKGQKNPNNQTPSDNKSHQKDAHNQTKSGNPKHHPSPNEEDEDDDRMQKDEKSPKTGKNESKSMQHGKDGKQQQDMKKPKLSNAADDGDDFPYHETPSEQEDERGFGDRNAQELKWIAEDEKTKKQTM